MHGGECMLCMHMDRLSGQVQLDPEALLEATCA